MCVDVCVCVFVCACSMCVRMCVCVGGGVVWGAACIYVAYSTRQKQFLETYGVASYISDCNEGCHELTLGVCTSLSSLTFLSRRLQRVTSGGAPADRKDVPAVEATPVVEGPPPPIKGDVNLVTVHRPHRGRADQL